MGLPHFPRFPDGFSHSLPLAAVSRNDTSIPSRRYQQLISKLVSPRILPLIHSFSTLEIPLMGQTLFSSLTCRLNAR
ncbi:hypothetical protein E2C01_091342 [Portunus trituberculatus]|uniref:Uncharacterized protein n=1 Tax=Portunus trituberculatus TaxID=210409 RepID=A0A5B7JUS0_PORTR|nr:hypothetical protein [Portunus trituberculatus]